MKETKTRGKGQAFIHLMGFLNEPKQFSSTAPTLSWDQAWIISEQNVVSSQKAKDLWKACIDLKAAMQPELQQCELLYNPSQLCKM